MRNLKFLSFVLVLFLLSSVMSPLCFAKLDYEAPAELKDLYYRSYYSEICERKDTATTSNVSYDGTSTLKLIPNINSKSGYINLDSYNSSIQSLKIDVTKYGTVAIIYKYVSNNPVKARPQFRLMSSGVFTKPSIMNAREELVANRWAIASFDLSVAISTIKPGINPIMKQFHYLPFGELNVNRLNADDEFYVSKLLFIPKKTTKLSYRKSYVEGSYDGNLGKYLFRSNNPLKRSEAAIMIARIMADSDRFVPASDSTTSFSDIKGHSAMKYIEFLEDKGFLKSYTKSFRPDDYISKAEFAELALRLEVFLESGSIELPKADNNPSKVIPAKSPYITRAEAVTLLNGILGRYPTDVFGYYSNKFIDVRTDTIAYYDIMDASMNHVTEIDENGVEKWLVIPGDTYGKENFDPNLTDGKAKYNEVNALINERIAEIRATPSITTKASGSTYYVSTHGSDENDGLSKSSPFKTASRASKSAKSGDVVLFERGCEWRERWQTVSGVTYSAYGNGAKPIFNGNTRGNAADPSLWTLVEGTTNVYKYANKVKDIGNIVLNGTSTVTKLMPNLKGSDHILNSAVFNPASSMTSNNTFICIYDNVSNGYVDVNSATATLYYRCYYGNPGEYYNSIELCERGHLVSIPGNAHLDNIELKYVGSHGFSMGSVNNVKFTNCEISYIGGSAQYYTSDQSTNYMVRFGNGIEVYGSCDGFDIDNCYVYQCYDAGITHQISAGGTNNITHKNVNYTNNVIDKCIYNIEYFMGAPNTGSTANRYMENILYKNNILARSGGGWGYSPSRSASIVGWGHHYNEARNFVIEDNIFFADNYNCLFIAAASADWIPTFRNNTYIRRYNQNFAKFGLMDHTTQYKFNKYAYDALTLGLGEENPKIYYYT